MVRFLKRGHSKAFQYVLLERKKKEKTFFKKKYVYNWVQYNVVLISLTGADVTGHD